MARRAQRVLTSDSGRRYVDTQELMQSTLEDIDAAPSGTKAEHERLRSAVVEAAQTYRNYMLNRATSHAGWLAETACCLDDQLNNAIDALNVFEAEHKVEE